MERVLLEVDAGMQGAGGLGQGKLRLTTERLVFERKKMFGGAGDVTSLSLSNIQSAGISGLMDKKLKVRAGSTEYVFTAAVGALGNKDRELKEISDRLQRSLAGQSLGTATQSESSAPAAPATASPSVEWLDELERLAKLHGAGALTDDEFTKAKARLLGG